MTTPGMTVQLSVVVTVVDGGATLDACLSALSRQRSAPLMEILVPYDDSLEEMDSLVDRFPSVRFIDMGTLETDKPVCGYAGKHELFDRRRARGLAEAEGSLVAILEDRGVPRPTWARAMFDLHELPYSVIGGAIENGVDRRINWAVYFCDFGRYQLPLGPRNVKFVSDVNVSYKHTALQSVKTHWKNRFHETTVHWALLREGHTLYLDPQPVVDQRREALTLIAAVQERFHWGRLFAYTRVRECGLLKRVLLALAAPLLPILLLARQISLQLRKRSRLGKFLSAVPVVILLLIAWSAGELVGYVTGDP